VAVVHHLRSFHQPEENEKSFSRESCKIASPKTLKDRMEAAEMGYWHRFDVEIYAI
jgi:hypothetical protein